MVHRFATTSYNCRTPPGELMEQVSQRLSQLGVPSERFGAAIVFIILAWLCHCLLHAADTQVLKYTINSGKICFGSNTTNSWWCWPSTFLGNTTNESSLSSKICAFSWPWNAVVASIGLPRTTRATMMQFSVSPSGLEYWKDLHASHAK